MPIPPNMAVVAWQTSRGNTAVSASGGVPSRIPTRPAAIWLPSSFWLVAAKWFRDLLHDLLRHRHRDGGGGDYRDDGHVPAGRPVAYICCADRSAFAVRTTFSPYLFCAEKMEMGLLFSDFSYIFHPGTNRRFMFQLVLNNVNLFPQIHNSSHKVICGAFHVCLKDTLLYLKIYCLVHLCASPLSSVFPANAANSSARPPWADSSPVTVPSRVASAGIPPGATWRVRSGAAVSPSPDRGPRLWPAAPPAVSCVLHRTKMGQLLKSLCLRLKLSQTLQTFALRRASSSCMSRNFSARFL